MLRFDRKQQKSVKQLSFNKKKKKKKIRKASHNLREYIFNECIQPRTYIQKTESILKKTITKHKL